MMSSVEDVINGDSPAYFGSFTIGDEVHAMPLRAGAYQNSPFLSSLWGIDDVPPDDLLFTSKEVEKFDKIREDAAMAPEDDAYVEDGLSDEAKHKYDSGEPRAKYAKPYDATKFMSENKVQYNEDLYKYHTESTNWWGSVKNAIADASGTAASTLAVTAGNVPAGLTAFAASLAKDVGYTLIKEFTVDQTKKGLGSIWNSLTKKKNKKNKKDKLKEDEDDDDKEMDHDGKNLEEPEEQPTQITSTYLTQFRKQYESVYKTLAPLSLYRQPAFTAYEDNQFAKFSYVGSGSGVSDFQSMAGNNVLHEHNKHEEALRYSGELYTYGTPDTGEVTKFGTNYSLEPKDNHRKVQVPNFYRSTPVDISWQPRESTPFIQKENNPMFTEVDTAISIPT